MRTLILIILGAAALAGCFPKTTAERRDLGPAPIVDTEAPNPRLAHYRRLYRQNRPEAPKEYRVFPIPPRDNSFGEFNDDLFQGIDRQPPLPPLPNDVRAMAAPAPAGAYPPPPAGFLSADATTTPPPRTAAALPPADGKPDGIVNNNNRFVPLEQLVYGGEYPDLDQPDAYRLMPRDVIHVTVKDHPEFSGRLEIQPDGTVRLPNAPDLVRLRGLTADEAADEIRRTLSVYIRDEGVVRVQTNRARGGYYFVFGDVLQPGRFPMGIEPIRLSDAVLAANWEANPARLDADGDDLGPSFPAASPRGRFIAPPSADLANVMLITPHRSRPARSVHDIRSAMLGATANDPVVRPGQIVVVPSLHVERNARLGIPMPGRGFSGANSPARLPEAFPDNGPADYQPMTAPSVSEVEANMARTFDSQLNAPESFPLHEAPGNDAGREVVMGEASVARREVVRELEEEYCESAPPPPEKGARPRGGWKKGF